MPAAREPPQPSLPRRRRQARPPPRNATWIASCPPLPPPRLPSDQGRSSQKTRTFVNVCCALAAVGEPHDEAQARPGVIDRADLVVDQAGGQDQFAQDVVAEVGLNAGAALRPG